MSGDYTLEESVYILFTTRAFATGIPGTLSASTVAVYEDVTATPIVTSIAVTEDLNSILGLNAVTIPATAATGFNAGGHYHVVIEAGLVDSVSVVGEVVGMFSIGHSAAYTRLGAPAAASVSADILVIDNFVDGLETSMALVPQSGGTTSWNATALAAINAEVDTAFASYDGPTRAELTSDKDEIITDLDDIKGTSFVKDTHSLIDLKTETALIVADTAEIGTAGVGLSNIGTIATVTTLTGHTAQTGDTYALANGLTGFAAIDTVVDTILVDTGTTIPNTITTLQSDTDDIQTRIPAALSSGNMKSDILAVSTSATAADNLEAHALESISVTFTTSGGSTTAAVLNLVDGSAASSTDDVYNGRILIFNVGTLDHQVAEITDYDGGTLTATISAVTTAPTSSHTARME